MRTVAGNVAEGPDGLLADIGLGAGQELDKDGDGTGLDDDLSLRGRARGNVGQGPGSLELDQGVGRSEEFDETADDTSLDDLLDRGVALLGEKLAELGGGVDLLFHLVGEDAGDHLGEVLVELRGGVSAMVSLGILPVCLLPVRCSPCRAISKVVWTKVWRGAVGLVLPQGNYPSPTSTAGPPNKTRSSGEL